MHKIDGPGHVGGQFVSEDAATGRAPTLVTPEWLNAVQGELATLVTAAGLALDKANSAQVLEALKMIFGDGPGAVSFFACPTAPVGYLKANGAAISRTAYAALFARVGTTFGAGDGGTTFALPDLRGEFLRGFDDGRGVDVWRELGSYQAGDIQSHTHRSPTTAGSGSQTTFLEWFTGFNPTAPDWDYGQAPPTSATGGTETRPRNVALLACIKY